MLKMAKSTYYYNLRLAHLQDKHKALKARIKGLFFKYKETYGVRRITAELRAQGSLVNHKLVERLMRQMELRSKYTKRNWTSFKGQVGRIADNLIARDFKAQAPCQKWATDVTEFKVNGQKIYLSAILDMYTREIVDFNLSQSPNLDLVVKSSKRAMKKFDKWIHQLTIDSDQGFQYQHDQYVGQFYLGEIKAGNEHPRIRQSMSRKGNCLDNAMMESFFGRLKTEFFYRKRFKSLRIFKRELRQYIRFYNNKRRNKALDYMTPIQFRENYYNCNC